jgi:CHASE3 domain sensor protein
MMKTLTICRAVGLLFLLICVPLLTSKAMSYFKVSTLNKNGARDVRKRACLFETF